LGRLAVTVTKSYLLGLFNKSSSSTTPNLFSAPLTSAMTRRPPRAHRRPRRRFDLDPECSQ
jgi:hypothetical protein